MMDDWELILQYMQLVMKASHLPKWGHYEVIDAHKDSNDENIYKKLKRSCKEMTENKRFEFREVNCSAITPKIYDTEKQQYANLFECVYWLNDLHKENEQLKQKVNFYKYFQKDARELEKENEELKKGMIRVINRYIKNVECNPPSSARTYKKIKGALVNIKEDLRDLIGDFE